VRVREIESSIASHLGGSERDISATERPEFDSYTSRLDPSVSKVVVAYFGAQQECGESERARSEVNGLVAQMSDVNGPAHHELSSYVDEAGYGTVIAACYWLSPESFDKWFAAIGKSWTASTEQGHFVEVLRPSVRRLETLHSSDQHLQGLGSLAVEPSGPIAEHGYWGGMRDRLPDSQADTLTASGMPAIVEGAVLTVKPHEELCVIRSGQDYGSTVGTERLFYLDEVEPQLRAGMDFLRDEGTTIGCFANRYVTVLDDDGAPTDKTYAVSLWRDMADLERWSKTHPTHARIFGAFMRHMNEFGADAALRLYHEVIVVPAKDQLFQYANCHPETGMLRVHKVS